MSSSQERDQWAALYDLRRDLEIMKTRLNELEYQNSSVLVFQLNQAEANSGGRGVVGPRRFRGVTG